MSVWYCIPSKRPPEQAEPVLRKWKEMGYKIALYVDADDLARNGVSAYCADFICDRQSDGNTAYPGYAQAVNQLVRYIWHEDWDWVVTGGDDVLPDPNHSADEIAEQLTEHFGGTFGICQPVADTWGEDELWAINAYPVGRRRYIERICGSPWMGREWCQRGHKGQGPLHPGFYHMHGDECLFETAQKLGILWQRYDLLHHHQHWGRKQGASPSDVPEFLRNVNTPEHWKESLALLNRIKASNFEECMPL